MTILESPFLHVDPVATAIGPVQIHWYAIMYLLAFTMACGLMRLRLRHQSLASIAKSSIWVPADIEDLLLYGIAGMTLGGRLGCVLFYRLGYYVTHPLDVFKAWDGRMSFRDGATGVVLGMAFFAWRQSRPFLQVADFLVPSVPIGLAAGRIGDFINGELWGCATPPGPPWVMRLPTDGNVLRHPSRLYQALLEGVLLFVLLWFYARKPRFRGQVATAFLADYGLFQFIAEYWREPDSQLGFLSLRLSIGQQLSVPMIPAGVALWLRARKRDISDVQEPADDPGKETVSENSEENTDDDIEKKSTGAVEESPETVDEAGETPAGKDETPGQS